MPFCLHTLFVDRHHAEMSRSMGWVAQGQELSQLRVWHAADDGAALLSVTFNPPRRSSAQSVPWTDQNKGDNMLINGCFDLVAVP